MQSLQWVNLMRLDWVWSPGDEGGDFWQKIESWKGHQLEKNYFALPLYRTNIYLAVITL